MYYLRLIWTFVKVNIQTSLAYRSEAVVEIVLDLIWLGWELISLQIIFSNTVSLGGWSKGELIALLGVLLLVNTFMAMFIWPNTEEFNASVRDGSFDYVLLMPVSSMFIVSFSRITVWRAVDILIAAALIVGGIRLSGHAILPINIYLFVLLAMSGSMVIYSLWLVLIAFTFWFTKFDNNVTILQALTDTGRYPATVYPWWLRVIVTFVVPIALATTIPIQALRGDLGAAQIWTFFGISLGSIAIASQVWRFGVKRYSGASS